MTVIWGGDSYYEDYNYFIVAENFNMAIKKWANEEVSDHQNAENVEINIKLIEYNSIIIK
jgi:hypothetical protein